MIECVFLLIIYSLTKEGPWVVHVKVGLGVLL